jgi:AcrR family transcriptional regulator
MTRLAKRRDTHLTREEIAAAALAEFDRGAEPSIRSLAAALRVTPSAIYHHFDSRAAIVEGAVELVWSEVGTEGSELVPDPLEEDPAEVLVGAAIATRRAWTRHNRLAPYMAATPASSDFLTGALAVFANAFERLGLEREQAGAAFYTYASYMIGSVLLASESTRRSLDQVMEVSAVDPERDEELFERGLRKLIASFTASHAS